MTAPVIARSRVIPASPAAIFDLLADPAAHARLDGSGSVRSAVGNPARLSLGATFAMNMRIGLPYRVTNTVVEFEEGRRIAWRHFGGHVWRYELEPVDGGTRVTETFDGSTSKAPVVLTLMGVARKHPLAMEATLQRLADAVAPTSTT
ncbi:MAG: SRPBCC family protein [Actinomycetota bacterium]|nr:SRPBCC family protein [Actinomycetota bacterium]